MDCWESKGQSNSSAWHGESKNDSKSSQMSDTLLLFVTMSSPDWHKVRSRHEGYTCIILAAVGGGLLSDILKADQRQISIFELRMIG